MQGRLVKTCSLDRGMKSVPGQFLASRIRECILLNTLTVVLKELQFSYFPQPNTVASQEDAVSMQPCAQNDRVFQLK